MPEILHSQKLGWTERDGWGNRHLMQFAMAITGTGQKKKVSTAHHFNHILMKTNDPSPNHFSPLLFSLCNNIFINLTEYTSISEFMYLGVLQYWHGQPIWRKSSSLYKVEPQSPYWFTGLAAVGPGRGDFWLWCANRWYLNSSSEECRHWCSVRAQQRRLMDHPMGTHAAIQPWQTGERLTRGGLGGWKFSLEEWKEDWRAEQPEETWWKEGTVNLKWRRCTCKTGLWHSNSGRCKAKIKTYMWN